MVNPCLSGGALEIFLEPMLPAPLVASSGDAGRRRLVAIAEVLGYATGRLQRRRFAGGRDGGDRGQPRPRRAETIRAALDAGVGYIALVASRNAAAARCWTSSGSTEAERARVQHAGRPRHRGPHRAGGRAVDPGRGRCRGPLGRRPAPRHAAAAPTPVQAIDPVCGMTVTVMADTPHLVVDGQDFWFCGTGCRERYAERRRDAGTGDRAVRRRRRRARRASTSVDYLVDEGMATALFLAADPRPAAAAGGRAGRRQDRGGQGAGPRRSTRR